MRAGIKECARAYAKKTGCTIAEGEKAVRATLEVMRDSLLEYGGVFYMNNFIIDVVERKAKRGINPNTREIEVVPAYNSLRIRVGKQLREELNKSRE